MALRLKSKLFYLAFKAFLIWPPPPIRLISCSSTYILVISNTHCSVSILHFLFHAFAHAHLHLVKPLHPTKPRSNAIASLQEVSHSPVYPSNPLVCYNVFIYILTPLSSSLKSPSLPVIPPQSEGVGMCGERRGKVGTSVPFSLVYYLPLSFWH